MSDKGCVLLDTRAFDNALDKKSDILKEYDAITKEYDTICKKLLENWKGKGADAFRKDCETVNTNIVGVQDILKTMCDTIADCRDIFAECDKTMGEYNRNPSSE